MPLDWHVENFECVYKGSFRGSHQAEPAPVSWRSVSISSRVIGNISKGLFHFKAVILMLPDDNVDSLIDLYIVFQRLYSRQDG